MIFPALKNLTLYVEEESVLFVNNSFPLLERFYALKLYSTSEFIPNIGSNLK
jgi:hypothetical protein